MWDHVKRAHEFMNPAGEFRFTRKVGNDHINLNSRSVMRVYLAEGIMSAEVAHMISEWVEQDPSAAPAAEVEFTIQYIMWGATLVEFYTKKASFRTNTKKEDCTGEFDPRLAELAGIVSAVQRWRAGLKGGDDDNEGVPDGQTFSQSFIPDHKLWYDLQLYQSSITGIIKMLLRAGHPFVSVCRLHSDYCEVSLRARSAYCKL